MSDNGLLIKVLRYAYRHHDKMITRNTLQKADTNVENKYIKSQAFEKNKTVRILAPLILKIDKDSIMFPTKPVRITSNQLNKLKTGLFTFEKMI